jgi:hypothetical protein
LKVQRYAAGGSIDLAFRHEIHCPIVAPRIYGRASLRAGEISTTRPGFA